MNYNLSQIEEIEHDFFGKKARARREARRDNRADRKIAKIDARATGRAGVASAGGGIGGIMNKVGGVLGNIFGGGGTMPVDNVSMRGGQFSAEFDTVGAEDEAARKQKMTMLIVGVVVLAVVGFFVYKKFAK